MSTLASKVEALGSGKSAREHEAQLALGRRSTDNVLEQVAAAYIDSAMAARQAHWATGGDRFTQRAGLFGELYIDLDQVADAFAAKLVARGATPPGTVHVLATRTSLPPFPLELKDKRELSEALSKRLKQLTTLTRRAIMALDHVNDPDTVHQLTEAAAVADKHRQLFEKQVKAA